MIAIQNLYKSYENGMVQALNDLSLDIAAGSAVALMGPSGCGKSTLLNLIGALDRPDRGAIAIDGRPLQTYQPFSRYRARMVGFVFQFHHLIPSLNLLENTMLPMAGQPLKPNARLSKARALLHATGLEHRLYFYPARVSGGERQRAAIARALANDPRIILADEPTGSVDSLTGQRVISFLLEYCRSRQMTVILATHNQRIAAMARRIIVMTDGRITGDSAFD